MHEFQVASVFSSNMVLQRDKNIRIFGWAPEGETVTAELFCGEKLISKNEAAAKNDRFTVVLPKLPGSRESYTLRVAAGSEEKVMTNIAIGEVWLCGGQSNMEMELQNIAGGREMLANDTNPDVRFYYTQKRPVIDEEFLRFEKMMVWKEFDAESAACWSGVGYLFGKELAKKLDCTVGLIGCNWGGTSASAWMNKEMLTEDKDVSLYLTEYEEKIAGKSLAEQKEAYDSYVLRNDEWQAKCAEMYNKDPNTEWGYVQEVLGPCEWPGPINEFNPFRPCGLYETMLERVAPYTMRGAIFYQGESDDHHPDLYFKLFGHMIENWRRLWDDPDLPMLFVQLPMHRYSADPDYKHWPKIREAQFHIYRTVRNTGMAVIIDSGEFNEIHPKDKRPVGHRLVNQALAEVYGMLSREEANGPLYRDTLFCGEKAVVSFDYADDGFTLSEGDSAAGFELAGEDKVFYPANAVLGKGSITLTSAEVNKPQYVRYLWTNYGPVNLYGTNGIPVAPFRSASSDQLGEQQVHVDIQQIMEL